MATGFLNNTQIDVALFKKGLPYSCDKFLSFISSSLLYDGIWEEDIVTNVLKTLKLYQVKLVFVYGISFVSSARSSYGHTTY